MQKSSRLKRIQRCKQIDAQAPKFGGNGHDRLAGNGRANRY
jgi:hypothetical protein